MKLRLRSKARYAFGAYPESPNLTDGSGLPSYTFATEYTSKKLIQNKFFIQTKAVWFCLYHYQEDIYAQYKYSKRYA